MKSSSPTDGLTSLISYAPQLPQVPILARFTHVQAQVEAQPRRSPPPLEVVSAKHSTSSTHITRFRSPPPQLAVPTEFAPLQRDLPKSTSIRQNEVAPEGGDNKKELRIRRCSERKEAPVACAESASNPLKKKKTVAFGRTINVSQTVEGNLMRRRTGVRLVKGHKNSVTTMGAEDLSALKGKVDELGRLVSELKKNDIEKEERIVKLENSVLERDRQVVKLTDMVKTLLDFASAETGGSERRPTDRDGYQKTKNFEMRRGRAGRENASRLEEKQQGVDEHKLRNLILRKWEESVAFRQHVQQGLMKFGGDHSLDTVANIKHEKMPVMRRVSGIDHDDERPHERCFTSAPVLKATRVTKQTTVEQIHCVESPARSNAFSLDSKKYLARHGLVSGVLDEEEEESDHRRECVSHDESLVESAYRPGQSVTYYPAHSIYNRAQSPRHASRRECLYLPQRDGKGIRHRYYVYEEQRGNRRNQDLSTKPQKLEYEVESSSDELLDNPVDLDDDGCELGMQPERTLNATYASCSPTREHVRYSEGYRAE